MKLLIYGLLFSFALAISSYAIEKRISATRKCEQLTNELGIGERLGCAVYATRDINVGEQITADAIETRLIANNKLPDHIVYRASKVIGQSPIYGIAKGQLLSQFDFQNAREDYKNCFKREDGSNPGLLP